MSARSRQRCPWVNDNPRMIAYHDTEWGAPLHDDRKLLEFLVLEGAQAGLSWETVLNKRAVYRKAFVNFNPRRVARFTSSDIRRLLNNAGIIRNRMKITSAINNAKCFLEVRKEFGSFDHYIWEFVKNRPVQHKIRTLKDYQPRDKISDAISKDLKERGFTFVGSTIMYAHMQATGMVNDHAVTCFRYRQVARLR